MVGEEKIVLESKEEELSAKYDVRMNNTLLKKNIKKEKGEFRIWEEKN